MKIPFIFSIFLLIAIQLKMDAAVPPPPFLIPPGSEIAANDKTIDRLVGPQRYYRHRYYRYSGNYPINLNQTFYYYRPYYGPYYRSYDPPNTVIPSYSNRQTGVYYRFR